MTGGDDRHDVPVSDPHESAPAPTRRAVTLSVSMVAAAGLVAAATLVPLPYVVQGPGPTIDVLGEDNGQRLITVEGAHAGTGELRLTTVSLAGSPTQSLHLGQVLAGWVNPDKQVLPVEQVFTTDRTKEEIDADNEAAMISSQEYATVAALEELGQEVPTTLTAVGVVPGTGADGVVAEGDVLTTLDGAALTSFSDLSARLGATPPGTVVQVGMIRGGEAVTASITTGDDGDGGSILGVYIDPEFHLPVPVTIQIDKVGGPSAGMMFALGIIDLLTPEDEANGVVIAGTGTIDLTGEVGPIGGIALKMIGAVDDGATWFIAPRDNCDDVTGRVPDGLEVVAVGTLSEARAAMVAIGAGTAQDLPTCG